MNRKTVFGLIVVIFAVAVPVPAQDDTTVDRSKSVNAIRALQRGAGEFLLAQTRESFRRWHPGALARRGRTPELILEDNWQSAPKDRLLVIAVHGFYSNRDRVAALLTSAAEDGYPVGRFEYASEQPLEDTVRLLSDRLKQIKREQPERQVALVTHSLGGVVARSVIEDSALDPGNVVKLIMVAPPNHGSKLANLGLDVDPAPALDEPDERQAATWGRAALLAAIGPVTAQVRTDSEYLAALNARPRNPRVRYSIFLGTKAPLPRVGAEALKLGLSESDRKWRWTRWVGDRVKPQLFDLPEFQTGLGDGVVSVESGRLEGVEDVVLLPFHHAEPLWDEDEEAVQQLFREILARLKRGERNAS